MAKISMSHTTVQLSRILHVDMDAYYASVEERENPRLAGRPVVVGGSPDGRGVVAAANYVARSYGVHSAMPAATAKRLCPEAIFLRSRMDFYAEISQQIRAIFHRYTPLVEPLSLDEAFLDVTDSEKLFGPAVEIAKDIKRDISEELALIASVGVASNKFLAKLASDLRKPDALVVVEPGREQAFLDPLPVGRLWGVGRVAGEALQRSNIRTIRDLREQRPEVLRSRFGQTGEHLWELAHGRDPRHVIPDHEAKSISHETTFETNVHSMDVLRACLLELTEQVARRVRRHGLRARTVQVKVRYADFRTFTNAHSMDVSSNLTRDLWTQADRLLAERMAVRRDGVRLLGIGVSGLTAPGPQQTHLFEEDARRKQASIDVVADAINERFGDAGIHRGRARTDHRSS